MSTPKKIGPESSAVDAASSLLCPEDGPAYEIINDDGTADLLLVCEHASNRMPKTLGTLGLDVDTLNSHIAWDPGAEAVARLLANRLDASLVLQRFSRLVYDCNRPPSAESAMPARSEIFDVPGNQQLSASERLARTLAIYAPFHRAVERQFDHRCTQGGYPALITVHSFTPVFHGQRRTVELGLLHDTDARLATLMLDLGQGQSSLETRLNEPYAPSDGVTHTLRRHAIARGLPNVMIEIRNDLISNPKGQTDVADSLARTIEAALFQLQESTDRQRRQASR
ncbi:MAG: N-formylglutamate amidohydrolase [Geminicoccaceae bacterium]